MVFERTLNIRRGDVGGPVTLLLCFQVPDPKELYHSQFSVAWRVAEFTGKGNENIDATYRSQLFVSNPQITGGNHIKPNVWVEINPGQRTALEKQGTGVSFKEPSPGAGQLIIAENLTGAPKDFGIGIVEGKKAIPLLQFPNIGHQSSLSAEFTPILKAYVVSGYQETVLLKGAIETRNPFWTQDIRPLRDFTDWVFSKDPETGVYSLKEDFLAY